MERRNDIMFNLINDSVNNRIDSSECTIMKMVFDDGKYVLTIFPDGTIVVFRYNVCDILEMVLSSRIASDADRRKVPTLEAWDYIMNQCDSDSDVLKVHQPGTYKDSIECVKLTHSESGRISDVMIRQAETKLVMEEYEFAYHSVNGNMKLYIHTDNDNHREIHLSPDGDIEKIIYSGEGIFIKKTFPEITFSGEIDYQVEYALNAIILK